MGFLLSILPLLANAPSYETDALRNISFPLAASSVLFATAQDERPAAGNKGKAEIVVEGTKAELRSTLREMLNTAQSSTQIGRIEQEFCPWVIGLPADWAEILQKLVRKNAQLAGLRLQPDGCRPSALVIFINEPKKLVLELGKADPSLFGNRTEAERIAIAKDDQPIYSWRVTEIRSANGEAMSRARSIPGRVANSKIGVDALIVRNAKAARTSENTRQDILLSFAVVDIERTVGKSLRQLADIATMHLLLDLTEKAQGLAEPDSILRLFSEETNLDSAPTQMSVTDKAMLSGTYRFIGNDQRADVQVGRIAQEVKRKKEEAQSAED
jgi:hypothetical protein